MVGVELSGFSEHFKRHLHQLIMIVTTI